MIERVARAICVAQGLDPDADCREVGDVMLDVALEDPRNCASYQIVKQARAAILAMREPDEAMCAAPGIGGVSAGDYNMAAFEAEAAWRSMIDEALRPSETQSAGDA